MLPKDANRFHQRQKRAEKILKAVVNKQRRTQIEAILQFAIFNNLTVEIQHFSSPDFITTIGTLYKIDLAEGTLQLEDRTEIALNHILDIYVD